MTSVKIAPGETISLLDASGPGLITHIWITIASPERYHLKKLVMRMFWDDEAFPSVETRSAIFSDLASETTSNLTLFFYPSPPIRH